MSASFFWLGREHRETVNVLDATRARIQVPSSTATLDGILILNEQGICLEANPAALTLFRGDRGGLIGEPIGKFCPSAGDFEDAWRRFLDRQYEHGETTDFARGWRDDLR